MEHGKHKVAKVMHEFKRGILKSSSGKKVTDHDQAMAIAMSEAGMSKKMMKKPKKGLAQRAQMGMSTGVRG